MTAPALAGVFMPECLVHLTESCPYCILNHWAFTSHECTAKIPTSKLLPKLI